MDSQSEDVVELEEGPEFPEERANPTNRPRINFNHPSIRLRQSIIPPNSVVQQPIDIEEEDEESGSSEDDVKKEINRTINKFGLDGLRK